MLASNLLLLLSSFTPLVRAASNPQSRPPLLPRVVEPSKTCTVNPLGNGRDDVPQILAAFRDCNNGGTVVFPEGETYSIATRLNPVIHDVTIDWRGTWLLSDDLAYWRANSYPIAFQNHHGGFVISGERIRIDGHGTGGINGNGNAWYNAEKANTQPGRPMPFLFWNVSDVTVEHFSVKDSPLWALNIMNGTRLRFRDITCNSTALRAPYGTNWVQNTDGFNTMDASDVELTDFYYQGGDDCVAIKPRSYNIFIRNVTCHGGNGIAIGSLGQYLEDSSVENLTIKDVHVQTYNDDMHNSAYIKTWIGELAPQGSNYESAGQPRGGGWGSVSNLRFENFYIQGAAGGPTIDQNSGNNGSFAGTSNMEVSNITFKNFTGWINTRSGRTASLSCSKRKPCYNIAFEDISLAASENGVPAGARGSCTNVKPGGVTGLTGSGCS
ncbi:pectin lyase-like protein [Cladorrhinum sp. PSN259]|nr:pectin lyase-like protein [Cladorrhinum sp. PSN259]